MSHGLPWVKSMHFPRPVRPNPQPKDPGTREAQIKLLINTPAGLLLLGIPLIFQNPSGAFVSEGSKAGSLSPGSWE